MVIKHMSRPIMNPNARFAYEKQIWETALANNGTLWHCKSTNDAIRITMRLNMYRRLLRDQSTNGLIAEDFYIVSRNDDKIAIKQRPPIEGYGTTLDGRPLQTPEQVQQQLLKNMFDEPKPKHNPDKPVDIEIV